MMIAETKTWQLGRYTIRQHPRFDNPAWPQYLVFRGDKLIGSSFSNPDVACCEWLEEQLKREAAESKALKASSDGRRGEWGRRGKVERDLRANLTTTNTVD